MGMFDGFLVSKSLLDPLLEESWKSAMHSSTEYYEFQTKSLEKALFYYYVESDKQLRLTRWNYTVDDLQYFEKEKINLTTEVLFYDYFATKTEQIAITFKAVFIKGELSSITLHNIERESLIDVRARNKKFEQERTVRETLWEMKLFRFLQSVEWKVHRYIWRRPKEIYNKLKDYLRNTADLKAAEIVKKLNT